MLRSSADTVENAMKGFVSLNPGLVLLGSERVVARRDYTQMGDKVRVVSGCFAGHEPWPLGFVGQGLLTAAVVGDVDCPPPSSVVLRTIRELTEGQTAGVLLVVQNIGGLRLNFGLAAERASNEDVDVKMVIVGDETSASGRFRTHRGLVGITFICKIAGAMSEEDYTLDEIFDLCNSAASNDLLTVNADMVRMTSVTDGDELEIGVSYRNSSFDSSSRQLTAQSSEDLSVSPRAYKELVHRPYTSPASAVELMLNNLLKRGSQVSLDTEAPVAIMLNNKGCSPKLEEYLFTLEAVKQLGEKGYNIKRVYTGSIFTSQDVPGFSLTVLSMPSSNVLRFLDAPTSAPDWPQNSWNGAAAEEPILNLLETVASCESGPGEPQSSGYKHLVTEKCASNVLQVLKFAAKSLIVCENQLNLFDDFGGDRDCGTKLRKGAEAIESAIDSGRLDARDLSRLFVDVGEILENIVAGTSGMLYSVFFAAASKAFESFGRRLPLREWTWLEALERGTEAICRLLDDSPGGGTLLDPLSAAAAEWRQQLLGPRRDPAGWSARLERVVGSAERSAAESADARTDTDVAQVPDPGAQAVALWLRAAYEAARLLY